MRELELTADERECLLRGDPSLSSLDEESPSPAGNTSFVPADRHANVGLEPPLEANLRQALTNVFHDFGLRLAATLGERARTTVDVQIAALEEPTYGEFVFSLDQPTCFQVIQSPPLSSPLLMELHPTLLFPLLDRLLGGGKLPATVVRRALTDIELRLVARISEWILEQWAAAWHPAAALQLQVTSTDSNSKLVRAARPGTPMLAVKFDVCLGDSRGHLWATIAQSALVEVRSQLLRAEAVAADPSQGPRPDQLVVSLAESTLQRNALLDLRVGDIITTESSPHEPATLLRDGRPTWRVRCGTHGGKKAIRIESPVKG